MTHNLWQALSGAPSFHNKLPAVTIPAIIDSTVEINITKFHSTDKIPRVYAKWHCIQFCKKNK